MTKLKVGDRARILPMDWNENKAGNKAAALRGRNVTVVSVAEGKDSLMAYNVQLDVSERNLWPVDTFWVGIDDLGKVDDGFDKFVMAAVNLAISRPNIDFFETLYDILEEQREDIHIKSLDAPFKNIDSESKLLAFIKENWEPDTEWTVDVQLSVTAKDAEGAQEEARAILADHGVYDWTVVSAKPVEDEN